MMQPSPSSSSANLAKRGNPLLAAAGSTFSLNESFGIAPQLHAPSPVSSPAVLPVASTPAASAPNTLQPNFSEMLQSSFNLSATDVVLPAMMAHSASETPRPSPAATPALSKVSSTSSLSSATGILGPPAPGVFLLPASPAFAAVSPAVSPVVPPMSIGAQQTVHKGISARTSRYVPPPGINSTSAVNMGAPAMNMGAPAMNMGAPAAMAPAQLQPHAPDASMSMYSSFVGEDSHASFVSAVHAPVQSLPPQTSDVAYHWFYRIGASERWKPFTMVDSMAIDSAFQRDPNTVEPVATDGGRYDVTIPDRIKSPVYWGINDEEPSEIRRCSWFFRSNVDGRWTPYDEALSSRLESEFTSAVYSGQWQRKVDISSGEYVVLHSPSVMLHFPANHSIGTNLDDWGQVQPQDPQQKPRVVHRGLEGLPDIPDGEAVDQVDHLVFVVHGVGAACDFKFRSINEVVDGFRELTGDMSGKHFQAAHLSGRVNRVEFLPVNWHTTLHGEDTGLDRRLKPLTLKSIPKLRDFVNDTLLDILFYTSPVYCQTIVDRVVSEINRMYTLFMVRNENFSGSVSLMGHSLGSLILFDILSHQTPKAGINMPEVVQKSTSAALLTAESAPGAESDLVSSTRDFSPSSLEELFAFLGLSQYTDVFVREGIDLASLRSSCTDDDLREAGLDAGARRKLIAFLSESKEKRTSTRLAGEDFRQSSVLYSIGRAGTGQPTVKYPRLCFEPAAFYALGSPIAMFMAVRGIDSLGTDFSLPTCPKFFNIFHPYDPVAYRVEALVSAENARLRPVIIPHHKGRKRMHLELKETVTRLMTTDIKQKIIDSVSATLSSFYNLATGTTSATSSVEQALEDTMSKKAAEEEREDEVNPRTLDSRLNGGQRVDFVLQEAPLESFNEYLFALASHLCYWESEDTCLMVLKDIYAQMNIFSDDGAGDPVPYLNTATVPPRLDYGSSLNAAPNSSSFVGSSNFAVRGSSFSSPATAMMPPSVISSTPLIAQTVPGLSPAAMASPPLMMSPQTAIPLPPASSSASRPGAHVAYPRPHSVASPPGMDPTAPINASGTALGPPPTAGFFSRPK